MWQFVPINNNCETERPRQRKKKVFKHRTDYFESIDDEQFFMRFRLTKTCAKYLLSLIEADIRPHTDRNNAVSPAVMLLLTLRFYALGTMLIAAGDFSGVSTSTAGGIIRKVSFAIAKLSSTYVKIPENRSELRRKFYAISAFPRVIGAIDCTHVKIQSPGGDRAEEYRNRKSIFSLNVQVLCGPDLRIMDLVARWPGSAHDSHIFNNSRLYSRLESGEFGTDVILGDSGYPNKNFLLTPLQSINTEGENLYNEAQIRTRNVVERCFGVWKRRFPVLSLGVRLKLPTVMAIIVATAVVHNLAIDCNVGEAPEESTVENRTENDQATEEHHNITEPYVNNENNSSSNNVTRNILISEYFSRL